MPAGTVVCGAMVVMQLLLLRIDIKGRKTNVRNSRDYGRLRRVQVLRRFGAPRGVGALLVGGAPVRGLLVLLVSACNGWRESVSPVGPGGGRISPADFDCCSARPPGVAVGGPGSVGRAPQS